APRPAARPAAPRLAAALAGRAALVGERLLPRMGPAPGAVGDALRRGLHLLSRVPRTRGGRECARGPGGAARALNPGTTSTRLRGNRGNGSAQRALELKQRDRRSEHGE